MKYFFFSLLILSTSFASEIEKVDYCDSAIARVSSIHREISQISADIIRESGGSESGFNCEEVQSNDSVLISSRDRLLADLKAAEQERAYRCPHSRPE